MLYCAWLADVERCASDDGERARVHGLLELLTPIAKSWPSEYCLEANKLAIQVHGGYGYTRDFPVERLYRDNRLNHIHEGTHGIHGLDLLGRKVPMQGGAALKDLFARMAATIGRGRGSAALAAHGEALTAAAATTSARRRARSCRRWAAIRSSRSRMRRSISTPGSRRRRLALARPGPGRGSCAAGRPGRRA